MCFGRPNKNEGFKSSRTQFLKFYARHFARCFLCVLLTLAVSTIHVARSPHEILANSGPTYWQGYPASELLVVDKDCPLTVEKETLVFDLGKDAMSYTVQGQVTATYAMKNPTEDHLTVQMAFPFISSLTDFAPGDITLTVDGENLLYELYLGDEVAIPRSRDTAGEEVSLLFGDILDQISPQPYQVQNFSANEKGRRYEIELKPKAEPIYFTVEFEFDPDQTLILSQGFGGYGLSGNRATLKGWCEKPERVELFVLGEDVDFQITAYLDSAGQEITDRYEYDVTVQEDDLKSYLLSRLKPDQVEDADFTFDDAQLFNICARALNRGFPSHHGLFSVEELGAQRYAQRIFVLVYQVDFPAQSTRTVTVGYKTSGTMDRTKTLTPIYTFHYFLNPARSWKSFGKLDIEIFTPEETPYLLESSIEFFKMGDNHYRATLNGLPPQDLTFSIYQKERVGLTDRAETIFRRTVWPLIAVLGVPALLIVLAGFTVKGILSRVKKFD